jgi:hypothetical protein
MQEIHDENEQTGGTKKEKERCRGDRDRGGWCFRGDEASPHNFHLNFEEQETSDGRPFWVCKFQTGLVGRVAAIEVISVVTKVSCKWSELDFFRFTTLVWFRTRIHSI